MDSIYLLIYHIHHIWYQSFPLTFWMILFALLKMRNSYLSLGPMIPKGIDSVYAVCRCLCVYRILSSLYRRSDG